MKRASDGVVLGYIRNTFDGQNSYTYGTLANSLTVQLSSVDSSAGFIEIRAVDGPDPAHPFVGAVGGSAGYNFNSGQLGYAAFPSPLLASSNGISLSTDTRIFPELDIVSFSSI